ncbi:ferritin-like fold-containing protein [Isoptericola jiangsuensis]|uniref:ferritin-like fold-containing protein n=1 Tax=Isoptericola jiangsuensis TaxID=548579 RepID=UPI003AABD43D
MSTSPRADGVDPASAPFHELVGFAAYTELAGFGLLAALSVDAADLATRQALADGAERALARQRALVALVAPKGGPTSGTAAQVMAPFDGVLAEFDTRTRTADWAEGLLTGVVGHGVAQDFCRALATGVPGSQGKDLRAVLDRLAHPSATPGEAEPILVLGRAAAADDVLASRLALWGRRVVGEALNLVTGQLDSRPMLAGLAADAARAAGADVGNGGRSWLVTRLTGEHTRRMDRLRLAA